MPLEAHLFKNMLQKSKNPKLLHMQRKLLIGYVFANRRYLRKILQWSERGKIGDFAVEVIPIDAPEFLDENGHINPADLIAAMPGIDLTLILVGDDNTTHPWLNFEQAAKQLQLKRYIMRIPYTTGEIPIEFKSLRTVAYNPNAIDKLLRIQDEISEPRELV